MDQFEATFFIGYDAREDEAARVCAASIKDRASAPVRVVRLEHRTLRASGLFDRPWRIDERGQFWDERDGRPFSTEFSHSRFLCFEIAAIMGYFHTCVFVDCDFVFLDDPLLLVHEHAATGKALSCVKRGQPQLTEGPKMDGMQQHTYPRKLWSPLFAFTGSHAAFSEWTPAYVNNAPGSEMHAFRSMAFDQIGDLDRSWHFIPGIDFDGDYETAGAIHYSEFSPWLNPEHATRWAYEPWYAARERLLGPSKTYFDRIALW